VETDKIAMEVEAPADGILRRPRGETGDVIPVTEVIGYVVGEDESWTPPAAEDDGAEGAETAVSPPESASKATPVARRVAAEAGVAIAEVTPGDGGKIKRGDVEAFLAKRETAVSGNGREKVRATPAARRLAREHEVDLHKVSGSGPRGRVQEADVESVLQTAEAEEAGAPQPAPAETAQAGDVLPVQGMRRTIAARMQQSYQTIPHITFTVTADMTAALALRRRLNAGAEKRGEAKLSLTAVVVKVCAWALERHSRLNASWEEDGIHLHEGANVGVAVALDEGLIVPVIPAAGRLGLGEIAAQLNDLTARARDGRLQPNEVQGGTFTISNLGMFGVDHFTAIINPPQSGILAVGRVAKQQVVVETDEGDQVAIRPMMQMTLSVDHRVVDGAVAAQFLQDVVAGLENPELLLW
jgi:pyruvate dehydrogenase E2 component (dihydrolipoamide acetyltransferase)